MMILTSALNDPPIHSWWFLPVHWMILLYIHDDPYRCTEWFSLTFVMILTGALIDHPRHSWWSLHVHWMVLLDFHGDPYRCTEWHWEWHRWPVCLVLVRWRCREPRMSCGTIGGSTLRGPHPHSSHTLPETRKGIRVNRCHRECVWTTVVGKIYLRNTWN